MLLADITSENATIGIVVVGLGALIIMIGGMLNIAVAAKTIFFPPPKVVDPDKEFVTREELRSAVSELEKKFDLMNTNLASRMDKASDYAHKTAHDTANAINVIGLKVERLVTIVEHPLATFKRKPIVQQDDDDPERDP